MHNKNIGTEQNGNRQVLLALSKNIRFLGKTFQYFFILNNIMSSTVILCLLLGMAVL